MFGHCRCRDICGPAVAMGAPGLASLDRLRKLHLLPRPQLPSVKLLGVLVLLTAAVVAQETRWAPIPKSNTTLLWSSIGLALVAYFVLRSGWGRPASHAAEQRALGTISNSYYEPRRSFIGGSFTIAGGVAGAMWWGSTSWLILVRGIEGTSAAHGLINLQISVTVGALSGGIVFAAIGLTVGELWELRHRRRRLRARAANQVA